MSFNHGCGIVPLVGVELEGLEWHWGLKNTGAGWLDVEAIY